MPRSAFRSLARTRLRQSFHLHSMKRSQWVGVTATAALALLSPGCYCFSAAHMHQDSTSTTATRIIPPPIARRENDRVVFAGVAPPGWDLKIPRQAADSTEPLLDPPVAVPDVYGWLRDESRSSPAVLEHLKQENAYTESMTEHLSDLRAELYQEFLQSMQETDHTVPRPDGDTFLYYTRTVQGKSYRLFCRAPQRENDTNNLCYYGQDDDDETVMTDAQRATVPVLAGEQVILDVNALAENQTYCAVGAVKRSPGDQRFLAYTVDFKGSEQCRLFIKDLDTQGIVHDAGPDATIDGTIEWGKDHRTLFYIQQDSAQRPFRVYRRRFDNDMKANQEEDELIFGELNDLYWVGMYKSLDGRYLFIETSSKESTEIHYVDLHSNTTQSLQCVAPRRPHVLYEVEHRKGTWWIVSSTGGRPNMALFTAPVGDPSAEWALVRDASEKIPFLMEIRCCRWTMSPVFRIMLWRLVRKEACLEFDST